MIMIREIMSFTLKGMVKQEFSIYKKISLFQDKTAFVAYMAGELLIILGVYSIL